MIPPLHRNLPVFEDCSPLPAADDDTVSLLGPGGVVMLLSLEAADSLATRLRQAVREMDREQDNAARPCLRLVA